MSPTRDQAKKVAHQEARRARAGQGNSNSAPSPHAFSDVDLINGELAEPIFIIPGLVPEGLSVLAGRPKQGKTFFAMNLADAVGRGGYALGSIQCEQGDVLFLSLEDNRRRLRKRRRMMLEGERIAPACGLKFELDWPRLDEGGLEKLEAACKANRLLKVIFIDTWKKICPRRHKNEDSYEHENLAAGSLQKLAAKYQIGIVIIHHSRKGIGSEDFVDDVLGSTGLTGAADTIIGFRRKRGTNEAEISVTGRDVDECEKALAGDPMTGLWRMLGDAGEHRRTRQQQEILDQLKGGAVRTVKELSDLLGERYDTIRMRCARMHTEGKLSRVGKAYCLPS